MLYKKTDEIKDIQSVQPPVITHSISELNIKVQEQIFILQQRSDPEEVKLQIGIEWRRN